MTRTRKPERKRRGGARLRTFVRKSHLWVGLVLSVVLFALAVSGSLLVYKEAYWRLVYPELRGPGPEPAAAEQARAIAHATRRFGPELRSVKMPEPGVAGYHLYLTDGEAFLAPGDLGVVDRWRPTERLPGLLFDLHAHLLAGERGEVFGGLVALAGAFLVVSGVILWWPARRRTSWRSIAPRSLTRPRLIALHRDLGLFVTPLLLVLLLTGAGIVFYGAAGTLLNGVFGDPPAPAEPVIAAPTHPARGPATARTLLAVGESFPDGRIVFYYPPAPDRETHRFRVKQPCELHPNGRSYVDLDGRGTVVRRTDPCVGPPGERALHALYPLHSGKTPSALYKLLTFLGGVALAVLAASGALAYGRQLFTRRGAAPATSSTGRRGRPPSTHSPQTSTPRSRSARA